MKRKAVEKAQELSTRLGGAIPVDVDALATLLGIKVVREKLPEDVSGVLYSPKTGSTMIVVNEEQHERRQRFSIAHEIGHFYLNHHTDVHVDKKMLFRDERSSTAVDPVEIDANTFAAELLMPQTAVREVFSELIEKYDDEDELLSAIAEKFKVSSAAMGYRLKNLGMYFS